MPPPPVPSTRPWNLLLSSYVRRALFREALALYASRMVPAGVRPDAFTYPSLLKACGALRDLRLGRELRSRLERDGFLSNLFVGNALVSMYARCGELGVAREVFDGMPHRDGVSWNAMISGYTAWGMWAEAVEVFERRVEVERTGELDVVAWNTAAGGYLELGNCREALRLVGQVRWRSRGSELDHVTLVVGLRACSRLGCIGTGKAIHAMALRACVEGIENVRNALITMYSRCRSIQCAHVLFRMAEVRSVVTWNCMITGYCSLDQADEAVSLLREMVGVGIDPNFVTVVTVLSLCARLADIQHGKELHCLILRRRLDDHRLLWNSLTDMYSKSGRVMEARRVFDSMADRDGVSYTSMIAGYGMQGQGVMAVKLFNEMIVCGHQPDHVAVVTVLSACSHAGLIKVGQKLFSNLVAGRYGVEPLMEHYSCMVDLFARAGLLGKAEEFLTVMPKQPTAAMWASLVGACHVYRNMEIGQRAATKLLEMATDNSGHYVLIANMYAAAGNWEMLGKMRILMRDIRLEKVPGCAWVDIGDGFRPFLVEDRYSSRCTEIYALMDVLSLHLRDIGYVGDGIMVLVAEGG